MPGQVPHPSSPQRPLGKRDILKRFKKSPDYIVVEQKENERISRLSHKDHEYLWDKTRTVRYLGWWWEIGAAMVSVNCTSLIVAILFSMKNRPLAKWTLPIQPNSMVAVLSTLAKSALLVPLAECIGQLKWTYFRRPRSLNYFQIFDEASRGPGGSAIFLWKTKLTALLPSLGAVLTILLLAFEPFTQQVMSFRSQNATLNNQLGTLTKSNRWVYSSTYPTREFGGSDFSGELSLIRIS